MRPSQPIPLLVTEDVAATGDTILRHLHALGVKPGYGEKYDRILLFPTTGAGVFRVKSATQTQLKAYLFGWFTFTRPTESGPQPVHTVSNNLLSYVFNDPNELLEETQGATPEE